MADDGGLSRVLARLERIPKAVREQVRAAVLQGAEEVAAAQRRLVPVDEGHLRQSIRVEPGAHELQAKVAAGGPLTTKPVRESKRTGAPLYDYALAVEFGTRTRPTRPFFYPGYRLTRKRVIGRIKRAASKAVRGLKANG